MAYTTEGITRLAASAFGGGHLLRARIDDSSKRIQLYVGGRLVDCQRAVDGAVAFWVPAHNPREPELLLAVDEGDERTSYWPEAWDYAAATGNRLTVTLPRAPMLYGARDEWRVCLDGDERHVAPIYPAGIGVGGYGTCYGADFGFEAVDAQGYGVTYGAYYGYGYDTLTWTSEAQAPGTYTVAVTVLDPVGNESDADSEDVVLRTFAAPATAPAIDSYVSATDLLVLTFSDSEDF